MGKDKRRQLINKDAPSMPGAGAYQIPTKIADGPKHVIQGRTRDPASFKTAVPGPGQYDNSNFEAGARSGPNPKFSIGKSLRSL